MKHHGVSRGLRGNKPWSRVAVPCGSLTARRKMLGSSPILATPLPPWPELPPSAHPTPAQPQDSWTHHSALGRPRTAKLSGESIPSPRLPWPPSQKRRPALSSPTCLGLHPNPDSRMETVKRPLTQNTPSSGEAPPKEMFCWGQDCGCPGSSQIRL